jgi:vacuolar protein sorting-associated protein 13A/C
MLKGFFLRVLNRFLGNYIENIDRHQLELGLFRGEVQISNLSLKPAIIAEVFRGKVVSNRIGRLRILIPWRHLSTKPIRVHIRDISIVLGSTEFCWCFAEGERCEDCSALQETRLMNKMDRVRVMLDAMQTQSETGPSFLEDCIRGGRIDLCIENVEVEYREGESIFARIERMAIDKTDTKKNLRAVQIVGLGFRLSSSTLGPLDLRVKLKLLQPGLLCRTSVYLEHCIVRVEEEVLARIVEKLMRYNRNRIQWDLFERHSAYHRLLLLTRNPANLNPEQYKRAWILLVELQKQRMQTRVQLSEVLEVLARAHRYRELLGKELSVSEAREVRSYEAAEPITRLLAIRKHIASKARKRSWHNMLLFGEARKERTIKRAQIRSKLEVKSLVIDYAGTYRLRVAQCVIRVQSMLDSFESSIALGEVAVLDLRGAGSYVSLELSKIEMHFVQGGTGGVLKAVVSEASLLQHSKMLALSESLSCLMSRFELPCFPAVKPRTNLRTELKVLQYHIPPDFILCANAEKRIQICGTNAKCSILADRINERLIISAVLPVLCVFLTGCDGTRMPVSSSFSASIISKEEATIVKLSKIRLSADDLLFKAGTDILSNNKRTSTLDCSIPAITSSARLEILLNGIRISKSGYKLQLSKVWFLGCENGVEATCSKCVLGNPGGKVICSIRRASLALNGGECTVMYSRTILKMEHISGLLNSGVQPEDGVGKMLDAIIIRRMDVLLLYKNLRLESVIHNLARAKLEKLLLSASSFSLQISVLLLRESLSIEKIEGKVSRKYRKDLDLILEMLGEISREKPSMALKDPAEIEVYGNSMLHMVSKGISLAIPSCPILIAYLHLEHAENSRRIEDNCFARLLVREMKQSGSRFVLRGSLDSSLDASFASTLLTLFSSTSSSNGADLDIEISLYVRVCTEHGGFAINSAISCMGHEGELELVFHSISVASKCGKSMEVRETCVAVRGAKEKSISISEINCTLSLFHVFLLYDFALKLGNKEEPLEMTFSVETIRIQALDINIRISNLGGNFDRATLSVALNDGIEGFSVACRMLNKQRLARIVSISGGLLYSTTIQKLAGFLLNEYEELCRHFVFKPSQESTLLMVYNSTVYLGDPYPSYPFFMLNVRLAYLNMESSTNILGTVIFSADVYNRKIMEFETALEETAVLVQKGGMLVDVRLSDTARILCSRNLVDELQGFIQCLSMCAKDKSRLSYSMGKTDLESLDWMCRTIEIEGRNARVQALAMRNYTSAPLKIAGMDTTLDGRQGSMLLLRHDERSVLLSISGGQVNIPVVRSNMATLRIGSSEFICSLSISNGIRFLDVFHCLNFRNLCNLSLKIRIHRHEMLMMELSLGRNSFSSIPLRHPFSLEVGLNDIFVSLGLVDMNKIRESAGGVRGTYTCKYSMGEEISIGVDIAVLFSDTPSIVTFIFYPTLEIFNRTSRELGFTVSGSMIVEEGGEDTLYMNTPFKLLPQQGQDVYVGEAGGSALLYNTENGARVRISGGGRKLLVRDGVEADLCIEPCVVSVLGKSHTLSQKLRIAVSTGTLVKNRLGSWVRINGCKCQVGENELSRQHTISELAFMGFKARERISLGSIPFKRILSIRGFKKKHGGVLWSKESILGGYDIKDALDMPWHSLDLLLRYDGVSALEIDYAFLIRNETPFDLIVVLDKRGILVGPMSSESLLSVSDGFYLFFTKEIDYADIRKYCVFVPNTGLKKHFSFGCSRHNLFSVTRESASTQSIFVVRSESEWPFIIWNHTSLDIEVSQEHDEIRHLVRSKSRYEYTPDNLLFDPVISLLLGSDRVLIYLNKTGCVRASGFAISIAQFNTCRVVQIVASGDSMSAIDEKRSHVNLLVDSAAISIIGDGNAELACCHLKGIEVAVGRKDEKTDSLTNTEFMFSLALGSIQVDNQSILCMFPVMAYPLSKSLRINRRTEQKLLKVELLVGMAVHYLFITNMHVLVQDVALDLEEALINKVYNIFRSPGNTGCRELKLQNVRVERVKAKINFLKDLNSDFISNIVGFLINNVSDLMLELDGLKESHVHTTVDGCVALFTDFYLSQLKKNSYKILTHLNFIGNIGSFTESVSSGIKSFIDEPRSRSYGVIRGSKNLIRNTIYGVSNTIGKVSKSISNSASLITFDNEFKSHLLHHLYIGDRELMAPRKTSVFGREAENLVESIASGIAGLAVAPIEGTSRGLPGLITGLGKGMIGAISKPIVGMADLVANVSDTIKNSVDGNMLLRIQYPRPPKHRLCPYDDIASKCFYIFTVLVRKLKDEVYVDGAVGLCGGEHYLILTNRRLLVSNYAGICRVLTENIRIHDNGFRAGECEMVIEKKEFLTSLLNELQYF